MSEAYVTIRTALDKAKQLVDIACDWNLDKVEIDGEMVDTRSLTGVFDAAIACVDLIEGEL